IWISLVIVSWIPCSCSVLCSGKLLGSTPCRSSRSQRERVCTENLLAILSNSASVGKPTSSNKPSSTTYMPTQIPPADPVRVLSQPCCVSNKVLTAVLPL
ncbi:hypothetical protein ATANTOWER_025788, partial [Ataeniobius toweri]|nr:hypothetical protein [Ataeniobius toweri]